MVVHTLIAERAVVAGGFQLAFSCVWTGTGKSQSPLVRSSTSLWEEWCRRTFSWRVSLLWTFTCQSSFPRGRRLLVVTAAW